jgi:long-chain acyl-CoA synthetase
MKQKTLHRALIEAAEKNKDKIAFNFFKDGRKSITYGEFLKTAEAVLSFLVKSGIKKADRVAIISENRYEWCASYLGVLMAGAVAVPVDMRLTPEEIKNIIVDSETKLIIHSAETENNVKEATTGLSVRFLNLDSSGLQEAGTTPDMEDADEDDIASLLYTSGTTGSPKAVMLTHRNFCSDAEAIIGAGIIANKDNVLSVLPLYHTYAFMCTFVVPVLLGGQITYPPALKAPELVSAMKEAGVTVLVGVPQLLQLMRDRILEKIKQLPSPVRGLVLKWLKLLGFLRRKTDINIGRFIFRPFGSQFRFFTSGGAKLDPEVMKDLEAIGFTVLEGYGLTETSPVVTFNPIEKRKPGSVGKPLPNVEIKIISPSSTGEGEIAIKGPMVMKGYYKNPEATASAIKDGWLLTGDLGYIDKEGYLFITGRLKELIVLSSGKNIYPEEVENNYLKAPLVREVCVIEQDGRLQAVIVPDTEYARKHKIGNISEALRWQIESISNNLPPHMRIKGYTLSPDPLPKTPLGKLRRFMIKGGIRKAPKEPDKTLLADETGRRVVECLTPLLTDKVPVQSSDSLDLDLGLDSLKRIELVVSLEKAFSIKLPEGFIAEVQTVKDLVEGIKRIRAAGYAAKAEDVEGIHAVLEKEPSDEDKKLIGLTRNVFEEFTALFLRGIVKLVLKLFFRLEVRGVENIPLPPFIVASNHASYFDGFVIGAGVPQKVFRSLYFQGYKRYFIGRLSSLFARLAHVIVIDPDVYLDRALQLSSYVMRQGGVLCIFPEGGRSFDGSIMPFKKGIGMLALGLNVPVVPARIKGTFEILPRGARFPKAGKITLTFGKPLLPSEMDLSKKAGGIDEYQLFADELRERIIKLGD